MSRRRRIQYPGGTYHVMARGNRKASIFETDRDRQHFIELLGDACERYDLRIYGACLMGNHYHVVGATPRGNLSEAMRFVNGVFAQQSNRRHGHSGHLFEARFRSLVIEREGYLKRVVRYVALNPVRARLVTSAGAWPWSTYRATVGLESAPPWLDLDWLLWAFEAQSLLEASARFARYVHDPTGRNLVVNTRALAIGTTGFRERMAEAARARTPGRGLPPGYRAPARPSLPEILGLDKGERRPCRAARVAHQQHGYRLSEIARHLGLDPSTVSKWLSRDRSREKGSGRERDATR